MELVKARVAIEGDCRRVRIEVVEGDVTLEREVETRNCRWNVARMLLQEWNCIGSGGICIWELKWLA
ncbi:hypothetical protein C5167_014502 [Papaver somniferum]|uniref:Uncharacterized protein n=1 Tax=Papaver somniferum TaxID=3469 RepID=A0A4Y7J6G9_PAPSO|nr:hypothetical protein C5167_014502 [Papaver somniferum]